MITHSKAFARTYYLISSYLRVEQKILSRIVILALLKNLLIIPIPYLIQLLVNDYMNMNLRAPLLLISGVIFVLLSLSSVFDNISIYFTEILKRDMFIRNFYKTYRTVLTPNRGEVNQTNVLQIPRFLEVSYAKEELALVLKNLSQVIITVIFGTIIVSSYHPLFFFYCLGLIFFTALAIIFFFPSALLFQTTVSDIKFRINERMMEFAGRLREDHNNRFFNVASMKYLKNSSHFFRILMKKYIFVALMIASAQGIFIFISGQLIFDQALSIGQFVASEIVLTYLLASIYNFTRSLPHFINMLVSLDKLDSVIKQET